MDVLKLGIPAGSLLKATVELFNRAGFSISDSERNYLPDIDDEQIEPICLRAQEISRYVENGVLDAGITGYDWIMENGSDVVQVAELAYSKSTNRPARWILAVPSESKIHKPEQLKGGIIATELVNVTKKYFADKKIDVKVEFSWGATEIKARLVDAIVELTETGTTLQANNLKVIDTVMQSTTRFIANKEAWTNSFKREKIENIAILLNAAIDARSRVGLKMNEKKQTSP
jgi:ATP phosphoribosyltransferase